MMFARTERLLLRPGWAEDAPALAAAIADEMIVRNLATAPWPYRLRDAEAFLAQPGLRAKRSVLANIFSLLRDPRLAPDRDCFGRRFGPFGYKEGRGGGFPLLPLRPCSELGGLPPLGAALYRPAPMRFPRS